MQNGDLIWQSEECKLYLFKFGKLYTNTGVFVNERAGEAFLIDSPYGSFQALTESILKNIAVGALFITHSHWDHIGDDYLFQQAGAKVYVHHNGRQITEDPEVLIPYTKTTFGLHPCPVAGEVVDGECMTVAGTDIRMSYVPGHASYSMSFYLPACGAVFVGDTLFHDAIGRYDFVDGDREQLLRSIKEKILTLPPDTVVVPGHGDLTTIGYEAVNNPFLRKFTCF